MIPRKASRGAIFGAPIALGVVSFAGLVVGLLGDGWYDAVAGLAVAVPVAVIGWSIARAWRGGWDR